MRPSRVGLAAVLAAAVILRFWDLGHGIPHVISADEHEIVSRAFHMMQAGTLNPGFFDYGQLHISVQLGVSILRFLAGSMTGEWHALSQATSHGFYVWGRAAVALLGVLTVLLVFRIGMRWGSRHALLAAALLAVLPTHIRYSHVVVPDVLLTFLLTLTLALALSAGEHGSLRGYAWAGAAAGLAAGTRYIGAVGVVMPLLACWMSSSSHHERVRGSIVTLGTALGGFLFAAPFTILELPAFLDRFAQLAAIARQAPMPENPALFRYVQALAEQFGWIGSNGPMTVFAWPTIALIAFGLVMGVIRAVRGPGRLPWTITLAFVAVHFVAIASRTISARTLLPVMPMLSVVTAAAVISGVSALRRYELARSLRTAMIIMLTAAVLAPSVVSAVKLTHDRSKASTQDLAYVWLRQNVPPTAVVVVEADAMTIPGWVVSGRGIPELRLKTYNEFASEGVDYLIASSAAYGKYLAAPQMHRDEYRAYTRLFSEAREVVRFAPGPAHPGPELRVLRVVP